MAAIVFELLWLTYIMSDLNLKVNLPIKLFCDNQVAIRIVENPVSHERTKHVGIDCHFIRTHYENGFVKPHYIPSMYQIAYVFTKSLSAATLQKIRFKLNLSYLQAQLEGGVMKFVQQDRQSEENRAHMVCCVLLNSDMQNTKCDEDIDQENGAIIKSIHDLIKPQTAVISDSEVTHGFTRLDRRRSCILCFYWWCSIPGKPKMVLDCL